LPAVVFVLKATVPLLRAEKLLALC